MNGNKYFDEWSESSPVGWWNEGRKKLNVIVRKVNERTLDGCSLLDAPCLLRVIDMGMQTDEFGKNGWGVNLEMMYEYVEIRAARVGRRDYNEDEG